MIDFLAEHWLVISFYVGIILALVVFRKKFEFQGKIVALYRADWGVRWMERFGKRHAGIIRKLGYVGIVAGFLGMLAIIAALFWGAYQLVVNPLAPPVVSPVLPGVAIPGSPFVFPLFKTIIALFVVIVVHEAAHGLVAAAHGMKVKSSGLLILGPIFGAFVEPDEEKLPKKPHKVQHSVFAAGPWSNILLAALFLGISILCLIAIQPLAAVDGVEFGEIVDGSPAAMAGLQEDTLYTTIDGRQVEHIGTLFAVLQNKTPGDTLAFAGPAGETSVTLGAHEDNATLPYVGVSGIDHRYSYERAHPILFGALTFFTGEPIAFSLSQQGVFYFIFVLALGLGLANLLPLGPVDGGRMLQLVLRDLFGKEKGDTVWVKTSIFVLVFVLILMLVPIFRAVLSGA